LSIPRTLFRRRDESRPGGVSGPLSVPPLAGLSSTRRSEDVTMDYVDGFVLAVPNRNKQDYVKIANEAAIVFKECGATRVVECWGDNVPDGKLTSFPMAVQCQADETVVFSWIVWPSRAVRDAGMEQFMKDPRMSSQMNSMPFDGKRLIYGGFQMVVDA
jgi:uncharacterized protein YbaA (DUF1428 family)